MKNLAAKKKKGTTAEHTARPQVPLVALAVDLTRRGASIRGFPTPLTSVLVVVTFFGLLCVAAGVVFAYATGADGAVTLKLLAPAVVLSAQLGRRVFAIEREKKE